MYAMLRTRPDIYYAIGMVSCYQSNLGQTHWRAAKRIFWNLRGTTDLALCYHDGDMVMQGEVVLRHISTSSMLADPLTKPIGLDIFRSHIRTMGMI